MPSRFPSQPARPAHLVCAAERRMADAAWPLTSALALVAMLSLVSAGTQPASGHHGIDDASLGLHLRP